MWPYPRAELVRAAVVVGRQLEHRLLVAHREEVVRRLELTVADDVELARESKPERLVEGAAPLRVGDPDHRVQEAGPRGHRKRGDLLGRNERDCARIAHG